MLRWSLAFERWRPLVAPRKGMVAFGKEHRQASARPSCAFSGCARLAPPKATNALAWE